MSERVEIETLTARGVGAIGVIAVRGGAARELLVSVCDAKQRERVAVLAVNATARLNVRDASGAVMDDALLVRTAEEAYELHVHGGTAIMAAVRRALGAGEEVERHVETLQGEVLAYLPRTLTMTAAKLIAAQRVEGLAAWVAEWMEKLARVGDAAVGAFHAAVGVVLGNGELLRPLIVPPRIALVGPPNVGKSTLANALMGRTVAITSPVAGTTRDWVDAMVVLTSGELQMAVTLVDTAGIHATADLLEQQAIERTHTQAALADRMLLLSEVGRAAEVSVEGDLHRTLIVHNKRDLLGVPVEEKEGAVTISALTGEGIDRLMERVFESFGLVGVRMEMPFPFTRRQTSLLLQLEQTHSAASAVLLLAGLQGTP